MSSEENLDQFVVITGTNRDIAKMCLDRCNGNLNEAIASFFTDDQSNILTSGSQNISQEANFKIPPVPVPGINRANEQKSNFATISSVREDKPHDPGQQAFYAGGSTSSGQQVLGPEDKKIDSHNLVKKMFEEAMKHQNNEYVDPENRKKAYIFGGTGHTLGETSTDSRKVQGAPLPKNTGGSDSEDEHRETILKLWEDGFSIDDGSLRSYQTPENQAFLRDVQRGQVPKELSLAANKRGQKLSMAMEDHRDEKYKPPKKVDKRFDGRGNRLGNPTYEAGTSDYLQQQQSTQSSNSASLNSKTDEGAANKFLNLQESEPNTRIQIRLPDGSRLVPQINLSRLVSDLRQYIQLARPDLAGRSFNFMSTFPNKIIDNETQTIQAAELSNASIVMRFI